MASPKYTLIGWSNSKTPHDIHQHYNTKKELMRDVNKLLNGKPIKIHELWDKYILPITFRVEKVLIWNTKIKKNEKVIPGDIGYDIK